MGGIAGTLGLPTAGPWTVEIEWTDPSNVLNEVRQTQVDAKAESDEAVILFEAKFGESDGGRCSQPLPDSKGLCQCNGSYAVQTNPKNGKVSPCALSGKGIRYWEAVPKVMRIESSQHHVPCPFSGSWYQWMRNLTLAYEYAESRRKAAAFVVIYADHPELPFPRALKQKGWANFVQSVRHDRMRLSTVTYQEVCALSVEQETPERATLVALQVWIAGKIERVGAGRRATPGG